MSFTAKTVILDIADNWGSTNNGIGIRSIEFWYDGVLIPNPASNFTARATSSRSSFYYPRYAFDTTVSKTGSDSYTSWLSSSTHITNRRLSCVFNDAITFDEIRINNYHNAGSLTNAGAQNIVITTSTDEITSTVYNAEITNSTVFYSGVLDQHVASDIVDEQVFIFVVQAVGSGGAVAGGNATSSTWTPLMPVSGGCVAGGSATVAPIGRLIMAGAGGGVAGGFGIREPIGRAVLSGVGGGIAGGGAAVAMNRYAVFAGAGGVVAGGAGTIFNSNMFYHDFCGNPVAGGLPPGFTALRTTETSWFVRTEQGATNFKVLESTIGSTSQYTPVAIDGWDSVGTNTVEAAVKFKYDDAGTSVTPIMLRGGVGVYDLGYTFGISFANLVIYTDGGSNHSTYVAGLAPDTYFCLRAWVGQVAGNQRVRCKIWRADLAEPVSWQLDVFNETHTNGGASGIFAVAANQTITWDVIAIGLNGAPADLTPQAPLAEPSTGDWISPLPRITAAASSGILSQGVLLGHRAGIKAYGGSTASLVTSLPSISGSASADILGFGRLTASKPVVVGQTGQSGRLTVFLPTLTASAAVDITALGQLVIRRPTVSGVLHAESAAVGNIIAPRTVLFGETTAIPGDDPDTIYATAVLTGLQPVLSGQASGDYRASGNIVVLKPKISGRSALSEDLAVIKYSRDCQFA